MDEKPDVTNDVFNPVSPFKRIEGPIFIGRTWREYEKMFNLELENLAEMKILDCAAGASSFRAHSAGKGVDVTAVDLLYSEKPDDLCVKCDEHLKILVESLRKIQSRFVWKFFSGPDDLKLSRTNACREFVSDYRINQAKSYIQGDIKNLPFGDEAFDLVLCSHLLFIYDHRLDYEFHLKAVLEMLRVAKGELRIYPLVKNRGVKSDFVDRIMDDVPDVKMEIVRVDYEFRKGGNEMLKIVKGGM
jgi:SAM-dependent methyltransferase